MKKPRSTAYFNAILISTMSLSNEHYNLNILKGREKLSKKMDLKGTQMIDYFLNGFCSDFRASIAILLSVSFLIISRDFVNMLYQTKLLALKHQLLW